MRNTPKRFYIHRAQPTKMMTMAQPLHTKYWRRFKEYPVTNLLMLQQIWGLSQGHLLKDAC